MTSKDYAGDPIILGVEETAAENYRHENKESLLLRYIRRNNVLFQKLGLEN